MQTATATKEKLQAASASVLSALLLTGMKVAAGVLSGSLGILAEAAHSSLDLVAALFTWGAIHLASKPPDRDHPYGHGKIENLSALAQTLLLLLTCGWICYEAIERLFFRPVHVAASVWSFLVIVISIAVDVYRSRKLQAAAIKHNSPALAADALHFSSDIWSSAVVLVGLGCTKLVDFFPAWGFLHKADALAALVVAAVVAIVTLKLGIKAVHGLLDAAPDGIPRTVKETVESIPGVSDCHRIRVRHSGPQLFIDLHVRLNGHQTLIEAHALTDKIERHLKKMWPGADVTVHAEPVRSTKLASN
ncbi:MAG: cation efflux protein [Pedosphaera sp.]|nr:cation efflux protein [Pedosphaera sp.]